MKISSGASVRAVSIERFVAAGLVVAVLDISFASAYWVWWRGATTFPRLLQSIASGLQGKAAFQGGTGSLVLGAAIHCAVAFGWTGVFVLLLRFWPAFRRKLAGRHGPLAVGLPFGLLVWIVMNDVVIPLSRDKATPVTASWFWVALVWHAIGVGWPLATVLQAAEN